MGLDSGTYYSRYRSKNINWNSILKNNRHGDTNKYDSEKEAKKKEAS